MERLDKILTVRYPDFSRSRIEGLVKAGFVTVNGAIAGKAGMKVKETDEIEVEVPPPVPAVPEPEAIPLDIVFEDEDLVVVDKAPGMVVHPAPGHFTGTLVNALLHHCPNLSGIGGVARPGIVHRLDQETSGLIVVAKSQPAMDGLVRAFSTHERVTKTYLAVCHGRPGLSAGRIENLIGRHPVDRKKMAIVERNGKLAITNWELLDSRFKDCLIDSDSSSAIQSNNSSILKSSNQTISSDSAVSSGNSSILKSSNQTISSSSAIQSNNSSILKSSNQTISLVRCRIETGRTHQIRVHMASLGCPVIGDKVYGKGSLDRKLDPVPARQMLHAWKLEFLHPVKGVKLSFEAPVPADMRPYVMQVR